MRQQSVSSITVLGDLGVTADRHSTVSHQQPPAQPAAHRRAAGTCTPSYLHPRLNVARLDWDFFSLGKNGHF